METLVIERLEKDLEKSWKSLGKGSEELKETKKRQKQYMHNK